MHNRETLAVLEMLRQRGQQRASGLRDANVPTRANVPPTSSVSPNLAFPHPYCFDREEDLRFELCWQQLSNLFGATGTSVTRMSRLTQIGRKGIGACPRSNDEMQWNYESRALPHSFNNDCDQFPASNGAGFSRALPHSFNSDCDQFPAFNGAGFSRALPHSFNSDCDQFPASNGAGFSRALPHSFNDDRDQFSAPNGILQNVLDTLNSDFDFATSPGISTQYIPSPGMDSQYVAPHSMSFFPSVQNSLPSLQEEQEPMKIVNPNRFHSEPVLSDAMRRRLSDDPSKLSRDLSSTPTRPFVSEGERVASHGWSVKDYDQSVFTRAQLLSRRPAMGKSPDGEGGESLLPNSRPTDELPDKAIGLSMTRTPDAVPSAVPLYDSFNSDLAYDVAEWGTPCLDAARVIEAQPVLPPLMPDAQTFPMQMPGPHLAPECIDEALSNMALCEFQSGPARDFHDSQDFTKFGLMPDGTPLPSQGSIGHFSKSCKPCLFWYTHRCVKGLRCHFCHIQHDLQEVRRVRPSKSTRKLLVEHKRHAEALS